MGSPDRPRDEGDVPRRFVVDFGQPVGPLQGRVRGVSGPFSLSAHQRKPLSALGESAGDPCMSRELRPGVRDPNDPVWQIAAESKAAYGNLDVVEKAPVINVPDRPGMTRADVELEVARQLFSDFDGDLDNLGDRFFDVISAMPEDHPAYARG